MKQSDLGKSLDPIPSQDGQKYPHGQPALKPNLLTLSYIFVQQLERGDGGDSSEQDEHVQDGVQGGPHGAQGRRQDCHHLTG